MSAVTLPSLGPGACFPKGAVKPDGILGTLTHSGSEPPPAPAAVRLELRDATPGVSLSAVVTLPSGRHVDVELLRFVINNDNRLEVHRTRDIGSVDIMLERVLELNYDGTLAAVLDAHRGCS